MTMTGATLVGKGSDILCPPVAQQCAHVDVELWGELRDYRAIQPTEELELELLRLMPNLRLSRLTDYWSSTTSEDLPCSSILGYF